MTVETGFTLLLRFREIGFLPSEKDGNSMDAFTARNRGDSFPALQLQGLPGRQIAGFSDYGQRMADGTRPVLRDGKSKRQCFLKSLARRADAVGQTELEGLFCAYLPGSEDEVGSPGNTHEVGVR